MPTLEFNPDAVPEGERDFSTLPPGRYVAQIIESELAATKAGTGQRLNLTFEIVEGPCARRRVWAGLNILNASAQAQEIGQRELKHICVAIGHTGVLRDSEDLHFKPMRIRVLVEDKNDGYAPKNVIKAYEPLGGAPRSAQPASVTSEPARPAAVAVGGGSAPWRR